MCNLYERQKKLLEVFYELKRLQFSTLHWPY